MDRVVAIYSKFSLMAVSFISVVIHTSWPMVQVEWLVRAVCSQMARLPPPNTASAHPASPHGRAASAAGRIPRFVTATTLGDSSITSDGVSATAVGNFFFGNVGANFLSNGTGDGASYTTYNFALNGWFGMALKDYSGTVHGVYNFRTGDWTTDGLATFRGTGNNYFAGNIGIGTAVPTEKLSVAGNMFMTGTRSEIYGTDRNHMIVFRGDQAGTVANETSYYQYGGTLAAGLGHRFFTGGLIASQTEKMRISDDGIYMAGNVGIGTASPGKKLDVQGSAKFGAGAYQSGAVVDIGNAGVDYPGNAGWAGTFNANLLLSGSDTTSISFHDAAASVGTLGHISNKFFFDGSQAWGPINLGINTRAAAGTLDVENGLNTATICLNGTCTSSLAGASYWALSGNNLYPTTIGNNVGIGTVSPGYKLDVSGDARANSIIVNGGGAWTPGVIYSDGNWGMLFRSRVAGAVAAFSFHNSADTVNIMNLLDNGNVGIGTVSPTAKLEVAGAVKITGSGIINSAGYELVQTSATDWTRWNQGSGATNGNAMYQSLSLGTGGLTVGAWENQAAGVLKVTQSAYLASTGGSVGIGTVSPTQKLDVAGNVNVSTGNCFMVNGTCIVGGGQWTTSVNDISNSNTGNVGIGTVSPTRKLDVNGYVRVRSINNEGGTIALDGQNGTTMYVENINGRFRLVNSPWTAEIFSINQSGDVAALTSMSAPRYCIGASCITAWPAGGGQWTTSGNDISNANTGNVGIGTVSPGNKLAVVAGADTWATTFYGLSTSNTVRIGTYTGVAAIGANNNAGNAWANLSINPGGGNVGIGTATPQGRLAVDTSGVNQWAGLFNYSSGTPAGALGIWTHGTTYALWAEGPVIGTSFLYNSDERLKKDIAPLHGSLDTLLDLKPVSYEWKDPSKGAGEQLGFIAQEVEQVVPSVVHTDPSTTIKSIDYVHLIPLLTGSIQELSKKLDDQEARLDAQQKELDELKAHMQATSGN